MHHLSLLGWVPPGYNYLGPGNTDFSKEPTNLSDQAARDHDLEYNKLIQQGHNPYWNFNQADQDFIDRTNQATDWGGKVGNFVFKTKKLIAPDLAGKAKEKKKNTEPSFSGRHLKAGVKRGKPFYLFVNLARKRARMGDAATDQPDGDAAAQAAAPGGAKASGVSGGAGGGGVGHSTGNFRNRTYFHYQGDEVTIVCHATRLVHLKMSESEEYKIFETDRGRKFPTDQALHGRDTINDSYHAVVWTPWFHLHANSWGCWFSPSEWQQLTATCRTLKPITFEQSIENVVIKTVTTQNVGELQTNAFNNDLTAILEVAMDNSNQMPWTADNGYMHSVGYVPWRACTIPSYTYHVNFWNTILRPSQPGGQRKWQEVKKGIQWEDVQFTPLETTIDIEMLRTGDSWHSGTYHFNTTETHLEYHWQSNRHIGEPHPSTVPDTISGVGNNLLPSGGWQWGDRTDPMSAATKVQDYHIGYAWPEWEFHYSTGGPCVNPGAPFSQAPWGSTTQTPRYTQGASSKAIIDYRHGNNTDQPGEGWWMNNSQMTGQTNWAPRDIHQEELSNKTPESNQVWYENYHNTFGPFTAVDDVGPQYPWGAIWTKEPGTTHKPMMSSHAPFICKDGPPGQLFLKIGPNYTDTFENQAYANSRIVTFATFWWSGTMVFKGKLRTPRQWNTYNYPSIPGHKGHKEYLPNELGRFQMPYMPGRAMPNYTV